MTPPRSRASASGPLLRLYRVLSPALAGASAAAAPFSDKLRTGLEGRRGLMERILAAAPQLGGCLWFHVTSVGEYEQARPVIAALRSGQPDRPIAVTHYSPSGMDYARKRPCADFHDYLPLDTPRDMSRLVRAWQPSALVFVKFDCWPNQVVEADRAGVPVFLLAGSLQPRSARLRGLGRVMYREVFDRFTHIGVCTPEDRDRFLEGLGVSCPVTVTGDTRAEQVILRFEEAEDGAVSRRLREWSPTTLVLGSTWPQDEQLWLPVLPDLLASHAELKIVLTPHEPLAQRLEDLEGALDRAGISHRRLGPFMDDPRGDDHAVCVVLVDSIGQLAEIYRAGTLAYVGGSFTTGVHNTMEPAVCGLPVMFGPVIGNAEEAGRMVDHGAGFVLRTPAEALNLAGKLLADRTRLDELGALARSIVLDQRGATDRSVAVLEKALTNRN